MISTDGQRAFDRPAVHFTPQYGWMNDPNGLVYANGLWHLYFQHNPNGSTWDNIGWGHAISRDLCTWQQQEDVLYPDADGMAFSGSAIVNRQGLLALPETALLYFFTAAGHTTPESMEKEYVQKTAYSTDGGQTLTLLPKLTLPALESENRDPKVFWHEPSRAYVMCLWLMNDEFGILRSKDLQSWSLSQRLSLPGGFECPDLFTLAVDGEKDPVWVFWTASGLWFSGSFDGYTFQPDGETGCAYRTALPYAAQSFANIPGRVISIPWLRCQNRGYDYTGAMGLPRELSLTRREGRLLLCQRIAREVEARFRPVPESETPVMPDCGALWIRTTLQSPGDVTWQIGDCALRYIQAEGTLYAGDERIALEPGLTDFSLLMDGTLLEITSDNDTLYAVVDLPQRPARTPVQVRTKQAAENRFWVTE